jgi:hypothetical protein
MKPALLSVIATAALSCACGSPMSTSPAPLMTTAKVISVTGDLSFGNVNIGSRSVRTFAINNSGNAPITFTSLSCTGTGGADFTASPSGGVVPANGSISVDVRFSPTLAEFYSCVLDVVGNQTSGDAAISASGTGVDINR